MSEQQPKGQAVLAPQGRRQPLEDAYKAAGLKPLTEAQQAALEAQAADLPDEDEPRQLGIPAEGDEDGLQPGEEGHVDAGEEAVPAWAIIPKDLTMPPAGKAVRYVKIPAEMTDYPDKGDRQCIVWNLTYADEKLAHKRCHGEPLRTVSEMTRATIRAIDGRKVNWASPRAPDGIDRWWDEIGQAARNLLQGLYVKRHGVSPEERVRFFANCVVETSSR